MISLVYDEPAGRWGFSDSQFDKYLFYGAKAVPGMSWDAHRRAWMGYPESSAILWKWLHEQTPHRGFLPPPPLSTFAPGDDPPGLRPYQAEGYHWLRAHTRGILADEMGLGKSLQALRATAGGRRLIIAPNTAKDVWRGELEKWGEAAALEPKGLTPQAIPGGVKSVLIHYELVNAWRGRLSVWNPTDVVIDEATAIGRSDSQKAKAVTALIQAPGRHTVVLTGTPLANRPHDLWHLVETIWPGRLGSFHGFGLRYCGAHQEDTRVRGGEVLPIWKYDGLTHAEELKWRLSHFLLRRTLEEVGLQLPPKLRQVIWLDLGEKTDRPAPTSPRGIALELARLTDKKLARVIEHVAGLVESGEKVVCFAHRREIAEAVATGVAGKLKQEGGVWTIHGGVGAARRIKILGEARAWPTASLLSVTIDTCGMGLDFTYAAVGVIAEPSYEPHKLLQLEARLHRHGAKRAVRLIYFLGKKTLDERIARTVINKLDDKWAPLFGSAGSLSEGLAGSESELIDEILSGVGA